MFNAKDASTQERMDWLGDWLRSLVVQQQLDPHKRLPPYETLGSPFHLNKHGVAKVIQRLRDEKIFPQRATRKDAHLPQWTERDRFLWNYIGHMHALRFDQVQRLAARTSVSEGTGKLLSVSRTWEIIDRWVQNKIAVYGHVYSEQSGGVRWIHLTRKGLREAGLTFPAQAPSLSTLKHLYWTNQVRMHFEDIYDASQMHWISERSIRAGMQRQAGDSQGQNGILVLIDEEGQRQTIDIKVQTCKPRQSQVQKVLSVQSGERTVDNPLRYYVNRQSRHVVRSVYQKMRKERRAMRSSIEIIDLEKWQSLLPPDNERL